MVVCVLQESEAATEPAVVSVDDVELPDVPTDKIKGKTCSLGVLPLRSYTCIQTAYCWQFQVQIRYLLNINSL